MKRKLLIVALLILALIGIGAVLEATNTIDLFGSSSKSGDKNDDSKPLPPKEISTSNGTSQTAPTDTGGRDTPATSSDQWSKSTSGLITVKSPVADSKFSAGDTVAGTAQVSSVYLRLVDDQVGVISQGDPITVVNGSFSAKLQFNAHASTGHLDVYSLNSSGAEVNEVRIPLKFQ